MKYCHYFFKHILYPACAIFTAIWFVICAIVDLVSDVININLTSGIMCFCIALGIALSNLILTKDSVSFVARFFLHMLFCVLSISITVALFSVSFETAYPLTGNSFYLVLILVLVYLVIATPILLIYHKFHIKKIKHEEYHSMFKK